MAPGFPIILCCIISLVSFQKMAMANTSAVAHCSSTEIIIAADSKQTYRFFENGIERTGTKTICKIIQIGDVFIVSAGLVQDNKVGYNSITLAMEACHNTHTLSEKVGAFEEFMKAKLPIALNRVRKENLDLFKHRFETGDRVAAEFFFAAVEKGQLKLISVDFMVAPINNDTINIISERHECPGCGSDTIYIGEKAAIRRFLDEKKTFASSSTVNVLRNLIELEIADKSETVGPPIDVLRIDKGGAKWIQKKSSCPEIQEVRGMFNR